MSHHELARDGRSVLTSLVSEGAAGTDLWAFGT
jgi:hypothetical protein